MKLHVVWLALAVIAVAQAGAPAAAVESGSGTVSGTVKDENGNPVVGLQIRLEQDLPVGRQGGGKGGVKVVGKATTDEHGYFEIRNVPPGIYRLVAGNKSIGWIYQDVEVRADQDTKLPDLKLVKVK